MSNSVTLFFYSLLSVLNSSHYLLSPYWDTRYDISKLVLQRLN